MSRVAKSPIKIPAGVEVKIEGQIISIKGAKGLLTSDIHRDVDVSKGDNVITFAPRTPAADPIAGTARAIVNNMVTGVTQGFERKLVLIGVGYRAQAQGKELSLTLGYSHPIKYIAPEGITFETPSQTEIVVKGVDKQRVGQVAAEIRDYRPPEPYKGKGVRYVDEVIVLKEGKKK
jgi:large subunit ribosomal protein L6